MSGIDLGCRKLCVSSSQFLSDITLLPICDIFLSCAGCAQAASRYSLVRATRKWEDDACTSSGCGKQSNIPSHHRYSLQLFGECCMYVNWFRVRVVSASSLCYFGSMTDSPNNKQLCNSPRTQDITVPPSRNPQRAQSLF